ncbi:MAG: response regulator [Candidatus Omnitrophica bacterium]|nr:response regulator [Candidatus Omnitrophota bacterium]
MIKILVVDDEIDICDFVKNFFEERNFRVFVALGGSEALRILRKEKPDLILLDIKMKEMDGIQTLERIRKLDKNVKVIMVSAVEDQDKMEAAKKLGASKYITKPLVLEELESAVKAHVKEGKNV